MSVFVESSTVMTVVEVTEDILPPLLTPLLTGSAISIIDDGLTIMPLSIEVVKLTTSVSLASLKSIARPNLAAWPLEVQAKAFTCFILEPILFIKLVSSTTSKSISFVSMLKYDTETTL